MYMYMYMFRDLFTVLHWMNALQWVTACRVNFSIHVLCARTLGGGGVVKCLLEQGFFEPATVFLFTQRE